MKNTRLRRATILLACAGALIAALSAGCGQTQQEPRPTTMAELKADMFTPPPPAMVAAMKAKYAAAQAAQAKMAAAAAASKNTPASN
jgi:outer membrane lipoprotein-sorting protein